MSERDLSLLSKEADMKRAADHLFNFSKDEQMRILAEARDKNRRDRIAEKQFVFEQGMEQGIEKGMEQGIEKGQKALVLNMLAKGLSVQEIAKWTGLKPQQISKLQKKK